MDHAGLLLGGAMGTNESLLYCPLPKPSCLALADSQDGGDLSDRLAVLEQSGRLTQQWRHRITAHPADPAAAIVESQRLRGRLERLGSSLPVPQLLKMNLESGALVG